MNRNPTNYGSITDPIVGFSGGNSDSEFNSLSDNIGTQVLTINTNIKKLQDALKVIGTPKDNAGVRDNIHETQSSTNQVVSATTKGINTLKSKISRNDKPKQLQVEKLEESFCDTVNKYFRLQKELVDKQKAHLLVAASIEHNVSDDEDNKEYQKQAQITRDLEFEQEMMIEREQRVRNIEADVLNINDIMRSLESVTFAQGEIIDTLENNIDHAVGNIEEGAEQLIKASTYQNRSRMKLFVLVLIGIIIVSILIAIIVTSIKK
ncbi:syntaxin 13 [Rhynchophorus ferrugineus]|uniref:t-SNARE coiled-coil homology domain-containing protein n=1 Tax=Rhynchophorus ferrugineus TaxID=354439 RepID=A0A834IZ02_RHYFE|nr:hypothetical protein GWI33_004941 [Rhynchophorus ferrugineus]